MLFEKIEGYDCGTKRHLHLNVDEAKRCHDTREERHEKWKLDLKVREAGWLVADLADRTLIAVNTKSGEGRFRQMPEGITFGDMHQIEKEFLTSLIGG